MVLLSIFVTFQSFSHCLRFYLVTTFQHICDVTPARVFRENFSLCCWAFFLLSHSLVISGLVSFKVSRIKLVHHHCSSLACASESPQAPLQPCSLQRIWLVVCRVGACFFPSCPSLVVCQKLCVTFL